MKLNKNKKVKKQHICVAYLSRHLVTTVTALSAAPRCDSRCESSFGSLLLAESCLAVKEAFIKTCWCSHPEYKQIRCDCFCTVCRPADFQEQHDAPDKCKRAHQVGYKCLSPLVIGYETCKILRENILFTHHPLMSN